MKNIPPALQAHLDSGTTTLAWCWRMTRADGTAFGFTDHDRVSYCAIAMPEYQGPEGN